MNVKLFISSVLFKKENTFMQLKEKMPVNEHSQSVA